MTIQTTATVLARGASRLSAGFALALFSLLSVAQAAVPAPGSSCTISALNRNAPVAPDSSFTIYNIPGSSGPFRARATCSDGTVGQTAIAFPQFGSTAVFTGDIVWGQLDPAPVALNLSAPDKRLTTGQTGQLTATAVAEDATTYDVTPLALGTTYTTSNALLATVSQDGLVSILPLFAPGSSARVVTTATSEGAVAGSFVFTLGPRGTLQGHITRADGVTPVAGAQITIVRNQPMEQAGSVVADAAGNYALPDANAGTFTLSVIDPVTGDRGKATARLETEGEIKTVDIKLNGQGTAVVTVVDASNSPVANTLVTMTALGAYRDTRTATTDGSGQVTFSGFAAGDFTVSARDAASGLVGTALGNLPVNGNLPITLRLQPVGTINGTVFGTDGATVQEGVQVRLLSRERGIVSQAVTGADGAFSFNPLPLSDGPYTLDAMQDGRLRARVPGIVISVPNQVVAQDVRLGSVGTVQGVVSDSGGSIFANAAVTLQSTDGLRLTFGTKTGADGRFIFPGVPVGNYTISVAADGGRTGTANGNVPSDNAVVTTNVQIAANGLVGTVFARDGVTPVGAGVTVYLVPSGVKLQLTIPQPALGVSSTTTNAQGQFGFAIATPDSYTIQAEDAAGNRGRTQVVITTINPAQPLTANVTLLGKGTVSGIVKDVAGLAQGGIPVKVTSQGAFTNTWETVTDLSGRYSVQDVFVGDIAAVAVNPATKLAGASKGRLLVEGESVTLDVTLAATGTVRGQVLKSDGITVAPGSVTVELSIQNVVVETLTALNGAAYAFDLVPVGDFSVTATEVATGDKGIAISRLTSPNEVRNLNVRLIGQGALRVRVVDEANAPVADARVTAKSLSAFKAEAILITDATGSAFFQPMFNGDFTVSASKPALVGQLSGSASGTLVNGATIDVPIALTNRPVGRVVGTVFGPDGVTPRAGAVVQLTPAPAQGGYTAFSDAAGRFAIEGVEGGTSYALTAQLIDVSVTNRLRIRAQATGVQVTTQDETVTRDLQMIGSGTVSGIVTRADGTPQGGISVVLRNPDPVFGPNGPNSLGNYGTASTADGHYLLPDIPAGDFTITASNPTGTLRAEGKGRVRFDNDAVAVDLTLVDNAVPMPYTLHDGNAMPFDIRGDGSVVTGRNSIFRGNGPDSRGMRLDIVVNGVAVPFLNGDGTIGRLTQNGQQIDVDEVHASGLNVARRVYVPRTGYFARYLEVLENRTQSPITVDVRVTSNHSESNGNPRIVDSSDGDTVLSVADPVNRDRWVVVDDLVDADPFQNIFSEPATGHIFDGAGGALQVGSAEYNLVGQTGKLQWQWNSVTVDPGKTVALAHFAFSQLNRYSARESALRLAQLPPEALDGLTTDERDAIRNFSIPAQGTNTLPPLSAVDAGAIRGKVLSGDGVTPIEGASVKLKSKHALFGREYRMTANDAGDYEFRAVVNGTQYAVAIPLYAFDLEATHPKTQATTPVAVGDFVSPATEVAKDLIFNGTGNVRGTVKRHSGGVVANADVRIYKPTDLYFPVSYGTSNAEGAYLLSGIPPLDYVLQAAMKHPQQGVNGIPVRGSVGTTATPAQTVVTDIIMEQTGTVAGIVRAANGDPVVGAQMKLFYGPTEARETLSDTAGRYRFVDVRTGSSRIEARDLTSGALGSAIADVQVDAETVADIGLQGFGTINVQVNFQRGVPATGVAVSTLVQSAERVVLTDSTGQAAFNVPVGSYAFTVKNQDDPYNQKLWGTGSATLSANGETVAVTITLPGMGVVKGMIVRPDGSTLAGGFPYTVRLVNGAVNQGRTGQSTTVGSYRMASLPLGSYVITAYDPQLDRFADAEFDLVADGGEVTVDLSLEDNRIALPADLHDANRFRFDIQHNGSVEQGTVHGGPTFDAGAAQLEVNGKPFAGDTSALLEAAKRQFAITQPTPIDGLTVTRKVFVPKGGYFARYLEIFDNTTANPITVDAKVNSNYPEAQIIASSSGNPSLSVADNWVVLDDQNDEDPALRPYVEAISQPATVHVFGQDNAVTRPDVVELSAGQGAKQSLMTRWSNLTVPPGGKVAVMHFVVQQINRGGARVAAERLAQLPPEALESLTDQEIGAIANFNVPPGGQSTLPSLPALTGSISGRAVEGDGVTPVRGAYVTFQSSHPLFNRVWGMKNDPLQGCGNNTAVSGLRADNTGNYSIIGALTATDSVAIPVDSEVKVEVQMPRSCFGYFSGHSFTRVPSRTYNDPMNGGAIQRDVLFDTGILTGTVSGPADFGITTGRAYRSTDNPDEPDYVYVPVQSDGTYTYPGLPPGTYDMMADTPHNQGSELRGERLGSVVTLGKTTVTDIQLQATGAITGTVVTANGEASVNARVELSGAVDGQQYDACAACAGANPGNVGKRSVARSATTDSLGRYSFNAVPVGSYVITVTDPISDGRKQVSLALADGQQAVQNVTLLGLGSVQLTALLPNGNPEVDALTYLYADAEGFEKVVGRTDAQGKVTVPNIPIGNYRIRVRDPRYPNDSFLDRTVAGTIASNGEVQQKSVTFLAVSSVQLTVVDKDNGSAPVANAKIFLTDAGRSRTYVGLTDASGTLLVPAVAQGNYTLVARATFNNAPEEVSASGAIDAANNGQTQLVRIEFKSSLVPLPWNLYDANRFGYDVQQDASTKSGLFGFGFAVPFVGGASKLELNGEAFGGAAQARLEAGQRQLAITQITPVQGLEVTRKVFVPQNGYFARYLEVFDNKSAAPITVNAKVSHRYRSSSPIVTSSGDAALQAGVDTWITMDDGTDNDPYDVTNSVPATAHVLGQPGAARSMDVLDFQSGAYDPNYGVNPKILASQWNALTVPAGGKVVLMHFAVQETSRAGARAAAERLAQLPPEALEALSVEEIAGIVNFAVPANGQSAVAALPVLTGAVGGRVLEGDSATPVPNTQVTVQSQHPLFGRKWRVSADNTGVYSVIGKRGDLDGISIPVDTPVTVKADQHPASRIASPVYSTSFAQAATALTQDIVFASGIVTGTVSGPNDYTLAGVYLQPYANGSPVGGRVGAKNDGSYTYGGLPAGSYELRVTASHPQGGDGLEGQQTGVQVAVGQSTTAGVALEPTGAVSGRVLNAAGQGVANQYLTLRGTGSRTMYRYTTADSSGAFNFTAVPVGTYELQAVDVRVNARTVVPLAVTQAQTTMQNLTLLGVGTVQMTVNYARGTPAQGAVVSLTSPSISGERNVGQTDAAGHLDVPVPVGSFALRAQHPVNTYSSAYATTTSGMLSTDGDLIPLTMSLKAVANVRVTVVDQDNGNAPVANAAVELSTTYGGRYLVGNTDASGQFVVRNIAEGGYTIHARAPTGVSASVAGTIDAAMDGQTIDKTASISGRFEKTGVISFAGERHLYSVQANAGDTIAVTVNGTQINTTPSMYLTRTRLYSPLKTALARGYSYDSRSNNVQVNESGDLKNTRADTAGFYTIAIESYYPNTPSYWGGYRAKASVNGTDVELLPYQGGGSVTGRVLRVDGTTPVANQIVGLQTYDYYASALGLNVRGSTDATGVFRFDNVPLESFTINVVDSLDSRSVATAANTLDTVAGVVTQDVQLPSQSTLQVDVLKSDNTSVGAGATVEVTDAIGWRQLKTDANGRVDAKAYGDSFTVKAASPGNAAVTAYAVVAGVDGQIVPVTLTLDWASVSGHVSYRSGSLAAGNYVLVTRAVDNSYVADTTTDAAGNYQFPFLPAGEGLSIGAMQPSNWVRSSISVTLSANQNLVGQDITLVGTGSVTGQVQFANGDPVPDAFVAAIYASDEFGGTGSNWANPDANGSFQIDNLPVGRPITLRAELTRGFGTVVTEATATIQNDGDTLSVPPLVFHQTGGALRISVRDPEGGLTGHSFQVSVDAGGNSLNGYYDGTNDYLVVGVPPGAATINVWDYNMARNLDTVAVNVVDGQEKAATLVVSKIKGAAHFSDGSVVPYPSVTVDWDDGSGNLLTFYGAGLDNGDYAVLGVPAGNFTLNVQDPGTGLGATVSGNLPSNDGLLALDVTLPPSGRVTGTLRNAANIPVPNAQVYLQSSGLNLDVSAYTDTQGIYVFNRVALGAITVRAQDPGTLLVSTATGVLAGDGQSIAINLAPPASGDISGQVVATDGTTPLVGATVTLATVESYGPFGSVSLNTVTDALGRYGFAAVLVGDVQLSARDPNNWNSLGAAIGTVTAGTTATADLRLGSAWPFLVDLSGTDGYRYQVDCQGNLNRGGTTDGSFDRAYWWSAYVLSVNGNAFPCADGARPSADGREVAIGPYQLSGVQVTRRIYVPPSGGYARFIETLTNKGASDITLPVGIEIYPGPAVGSNHIVTAPGATANRYAVTDNNAACCIPAIGHVFGEAAAALSVSETRFDAASFVNGYGWSITVPAGGTASLMHFGIQRAPDDAAGVQIEAEALSTLSAPSMLNNMNAADKARVKNFAIP
jgi:hypothetical protein